MKKFGLLLIVLFTLSMVLRASAQSRIGFLAGLNLANMGSDRLEDLGIEYSTRIGVGFGGVIDLGLSENLALHLEPMYLQKGTKQEFKGIEGTFKATAKLSYIEVPVMFKLALGTSTTRPYVMAGPTIGLLLGAKASSDEGEEDIKEALKDSDFGLGFGVGVSFPVGNNSIFVEGRYALGLSNINDDPELDKIDAEVKTKGIQLLAGITLPLGR